MRSWRTNLGGAFQALGVALMGTGVLPQLNGPPSTLLTAIAVAGFIAAALGAFFTALFAADHKTLTNAVKDQTDTIMREKLGEADDGK